MHYHYESEPPQSAKRSFRQELDDATIDLLITKYGEFLRIAAAEKGLTPEELLEVLDEMGDVLNKFVEER